MMENWVALGLACTFDNINKSNSRKRKTSLSSSSGMNHMLAKAITLKSCLLNNGLRNLRLIDYTLRLIAEMKLG